MRLHILFVLYKSPFIPQTSIFLHLSGARLQGQQPKPRLSSTQSLPPAYPVEHCKLKDIISQVSPGKTKSKKIKKKKKRQELDPMTKKLLFFKKIKVNKPLILIKMKIKSLFACWSWNWILVTSQILGRKHHTRCHSK